MEKPLETLRERIDVAICCDTCAFYNGHLLHCGWVGIFKPVYPVEVCDHHEPTEPDESEER